MPQIKLRTPLWAAALLALFAPAPGSSLAAQELPELLDPAVVQPVEAERSQRCVRLAPALMREGDSEWVDEDELRAFAERCTNLIMLREPVRAECRESGPNQLCAHLDALEAGAEEITFPLGLCGGRPTTPCDPGEEPRQMQQVPLALQVAEDVDALLALREDNAWVPFQPLGRNRQGQVGGGVTGVRVRIGNQVVTVAVRVSVQNRDQLGENLERAEEMSTSLGLPTAFGEFWAFPGLELGTNISRDTELAEEYSLWTLHEGEVLDLATGRPPEQGVLSHNALFSSELRDALLAGRPLFLSARAEGGTYEDDLWRIRVPVEGQSEQLGALLDYLEGPVGEDLEKLGGGG